MKFLFFLLFTVLSQQYEVRVYDEFVIRDNTAVLKCHIPSFVRDYVTTTAWFRDDGLVIHADGTQGNAKIILHIYIHAYTILIGISIRLIVMVNILMKELCRMM